MKFILMVMVLSADTSTPTAIEMQEFGSHKACQLAAREATQICNLVAIDGGQQPVCLHFNNIRASCLKAK